MWEYVKHRMTFDGAHGLDVTELQRSLKGVGNADLVFARCHFDGTIYIQTCRTKFQEQATDQCPFCSEKDGFYHRAWVCPHFAACRSHLTPAQLALIPRLPSYLTGHGWPLLQPEWLTLVHWLVKITIPVELELPDHLAQGDRLELFVDGACSDPADYRLRLAAWVVTCAGPWDAPLHHDLLGGGVVPGPIQTGLRGELWAAFRAVELVARRNKRARVWSDNLSVVRRLRRLLRGGRAPVNHPHFDLWSNIGQLVQDLPEGQIEVVKVVSHADQQKVLSEVESWAFWQNELVDAAAGSFNAARPSEVWRVWKSANQAVEERRCLCAVILKVHLQIGRVVDKELKPDKVLVKNPLRDCPVQVLEIPDKWVLPTNMIPKYGQTNLDNLHYWWTRIGVKALLHSGEKKNNWISGT